MADETSLTQDPREALAQLEVGRTDVTRGGVLALVLVSAAVVFTVPALQLSAEWRRGDVVAHWGVSLPASAAALHLAPTGAELQGVIQSGGLRPRLQALRAVNARMLRDIVEYEDAVEADSIAVAATIPPAQAVLTGWLKAGNENAYCGRKGWLFYRPDFDYATRAGFLEEKVLRARRARGSEQTDAPQPDPIVAIVEFAQALKARGIDLIVLPAPSKSTVHPEFLSRRYEGADIPIQNPSFAEFTARLDAAGVKVFDPAPALAAMDGPPAYLATDTHWTPEAAARTAQALAEFLSRETGIGRSAETKYTATEVPVTATGDVAAMLKLPGVEGYYAPESVTLRQVRDSDGELWRPDPAADILFLGDSFSNLYSLAGMGFGESAGFAEQLSYELQRPIDAIRINDNGSYATRRELDREIAAGRDRLDGKRIVIYEFAARELASGDWKTGYGYANPPSGPARESKAAERVVVRASVNAIAKTPQPGTVPYRDCVIAVHLKQVVTAEGDIESNEALVFVWGMIDNQRQPAADWRIGQEVSLELVPWSGVADEFGSYNRIELDDGALLLMEPYWGVAPGAEARAAAPETAPERTVQRQPAATAGTAPAANAEADPAFIAEIRAQVDSLTAADRMVFRGADDWLFFRPELRHLGAGAFWGDAAKSVSAATNPEYADPLATIVDFHAQLAAAGIELILAPVPPKAVIYPDRLSESIALAAGTPPRVDSTLREFYQLLRERGVTVLDLSDAMLAARAAGREMFCQQDTHYSGAACALFAQHIARELADKAWLAEVPRKKYTSTPKTQEITGDLWQFLGDVGLAKETLRLDVVEEDGAPGPIEAWRESPVLLLGDSHCLVFHEGGDMHATGAGLPDHLAKELGFPADLVAVRGSGATPARMNLVRRRDNLAGKKVVVWCFTAREFTEAPGGWRPLPVVQR